MQTRYAKYVVVVEATAHEQQVALQKPQNRLIAVVRSRRVKLRLEEQALVFGQEV